MRLRREALPRPTAADRLDAPLRRAVVPQRRLCALLEGQAKGTPSAGPAAIQNKAAEEEAAAKLAAKLAAAEDVAVEMSNTA